MFSWQPTIFDDVSWKQRPSLIRPYFADVIMITWPWSHDAWNVSQQQYNLSREPKEEWRKIDQSNLRMSSEQPIAWVDVECMQRPLLIRPYWAVVTITTSPCWHVALKVSQLQKDKLWPAEWQRNITLEYQPGILCCKSLQSGSIDSSSCGHILLTSSWWPHLAYRWHWRSPSCRTQGCDLR